MHQLIFLACYLVVGFFVGVALSARLVLPYQPSRARFARSVAIWAVLWLPTLAFLALLYPIAVYAHRGMVATNYLEKEDRP